MISSLLAVNTLLSMQQGMHVCVFCKKLSLSHSDKVFLGVSPSIDHSTCPKWEIDFLRFSLLSLSEAN